MSDKVDDIIIYPQHPWFSSEQAPFMYAIPLSRSWFLSMSLL